MAIDKKDILDLCPLTPMQEGMLYHTDEEGGSAYFEQLTIHLSGMIDSKRFAEAWTILLQRHEVLRSRFVYRNAPRPLHVLLKQDRPVFHFEDLSAQEAQEQESRLHAYAELEKTKKFDLEQECLRVALFQTGSEQAVVLWSYHHIILDGWSTGLLLDELRSIYDVLSSGQESSLTPAPSYRSYVQWRKKSLASNALEYWKNVLQNHQQPTTLPKRSTKNTYQLSENGFVLGLDDTAQLSALAREWGITESALLQAAWAVLLGHYNRSDDVVFGMTVSGRPPEVSRIDGMAGLFINTIPVRAQLRWDEGFEALAKALHQQGAEGQEHHYGSLAEIQTLTPLGNHLIDHLLVIESYPIDESALLRSEGSLRITKVDTFEHAHYDLAITILPSEKLQVRFHFNQNAFEKGFISDLADQFQTILQSSLRHPTSTLKELDFMPEAQQKRLDDFQGKEIFFERDATLADLIERQAEATPHNSALIYREHHYSFASMNESANRIAHGILAHCTLSPDTIITILLPRSDRLVFGALGILKAGGAYLCIDPDYPKERIAYMLEDSGTPIIITDPSYVCLIPESNHASVLKIETLLTTEASHNPLRQTTTEHLAYLVYTSGSTGRPKGVMIEHRGMVNLARRGAEAHELGPGERMLQFASPSFDAFAYETFLALPSGAALVVADKEILGDLKRFGDYLQHQQVTATILPPSFLSMLDPAAIPTVRALVTGGEAAVVADALSYAQLKRYYNAYGPSEATVCISIHPVDVSRDYGHSIPIGKPLGNVEVFITDIEGRILPPGMPGEIRVGGVGVARGYLNRPELTAQVFVSHPTKSGERVYRTGDLARWLPDGEIEYLGRVDDQLKIRGFRIEPGEIEQALLSHPEIQNAVVLARGESTKHLVAYIVPDPASSVDFQNRYTSICRQYLESRLPDFMVPGSFILLESIPLTPNGKVDKQALPDPEHSVEQQTYAPPTTPLEEQLCSLFAQVLELKGEQPLSVHVSFFELGGHSLKAMRLKSLIQKKLNKNLTLPLLFDHPTVYELSRALEKEESTAFASIPALEPSASYPVSYAQKRLWVLDQIGEGKSAYHISGAIELTNPDEDGLRQSLFGLVERHESLRTTFIVEDGEPRQVIHPADATFSKAFSTTTLLTPEISGFLEQEAARPFDLEKGPLAQFHLIWFPEKETDTKKALLFLHLHHIISDGWSMEMLLKELFVFYHAFRKGSKPELALLPIQYKEYASWHNRLLQDQEVIRRHQAFWYQLLEHPPALELFTDFPRPPIQQFEGDSVLFAFDSDVSQALSGLARREGSTLFMTLLALVNVLLFRHTQQDDLIVGSPMAGREHEELKGLMGMFVNTLPLRTRLDPDQCFFHLLARIKQQVLEAYDHQSYPFDKLVEELGLTRDLSRNPLFDVVVALQDSSSSLSGNTQDFTPLDISGHTSKFDLTFYFEEKSDRLEGTIEYATSLFKKETVETLRDRLLFLADAITQEAHRSTPIARLPLLDLKEQQVLESFNNTSLDYCKDKSLPELFEAQVLSHPKQPAIIFGDTALTYAELNARANQLAHYLSEQKISSEALVVVCMERNEWLVIAMLAILKAGGAYLPIDPSYPQERITTILEDAKPSLILCDPQQAALLESLKSGEGLVIPSLEALSKRPADNPFVSIPSNQLAYVIYTSGSTGKPKGVMVEHRGVVNLSEWHRCFYDVTPDSQATMFSSISFDASIWEIFPYLLSGATLHHVPPELRLDPEGLESFLKQHRCTHLFLPTPLFEQIKSRFADTLSGEIKFLIGADTLRSTDLHSLEVYNNYGPTESTVVATASKLQEGRIPPPIGAPIGNTRIYILDKHQQPLPIGTPGEICIAGEGLARGYLNQPQLTEEKFITHPAYGRLYRSGDLGRWLPDGQIEFLGRSDDQVKIRGYRIEPGEINQLLLTHEAIEDSLVLARGEAEKQLVAYVIPSTKTTQNLPELLHLFLEEKLPDYMVPASILLLSDFPLTPNGKIDIKALPNPKTKSSSHVAPQGFEEQLLCQLYGEILNHSNVSADAGFFSLGGDSIKAIQLSARLHERGYRLEIRDLFAHPAPHNLAPRLVSIHKTSTERKTCESAPLSPIQRWFLSTYPSGAGREWFNQSLLLELDSSISPETLRKALELLFQRHSALRLQIDSDKQWQRFLSPQESSLSLEEVDITAEKDPETSAQRLMMQMQQSMNPCGGPLFKAAFIRTKQGNQLYLLAHHLCVDGISWRILLEDLQVAYEAVHQNVDPVFAPPSDEYGHWCQALVEDSKTFPDDEAAYWQQIESKITPLLPDIDEPGSFDSALTIERVLEVEETALLLGKAHEAYGTGPEDLLLVALSRALHTLTGTVEQVVSLEGHGRTPLSDLQISRTVGWFTALYPALLSWRDSLPEHIKRLKEMLRNVPQKGTGYGVFRWLGDTEASPAKPHMVFNYLGEFDTDGKEALFRLVENPNIPNVDPKARRIAPLDLECIVYGGCFRAMLLGEPRHQEIMLRLMDAFMQELTSILHHCASQPVRSLSPSDTDDPALSIDLLEKLLEPFPMGGVTNVYPLTPLQEGIWLHALARGKETPYFEQFELYLEGAVDAVIMEKSAQMLTARHEVLRSRISATGLESPRQIILDRDDPEFFHENWQEMNKDDQRAALASLKENDQRRYFDLEHESPWRMQLLQLASNRHLLLWSVHHAALDGWSLALLMEELLNAYGALRQGRTPTLPAVQPFSSYVRWLRQQNHDASLQFWQKRLEGYGRSTGIPFDQSGQQGYEQEIREFWLDEETSRTLDHKARKSGSTPGVLAQILWAMVLAERNQSDDVLFAATVSGRPGELAGVERICGLFINAIPVRIQLSAVENLGQLLQRINQEALQAQPHHYCSLAEIQAAHPLGRKLLDHILVYENYPFEEDEVAKIAEQCGFVMKDGEAYEQTNYDLDVTFLPGKRLGVRFKYNARRYHTATFEQIEADLKKLADSFIQKPDVPLGEFALKPTAQPESLPIVVASTFTDTPLITPLEWWNKQIPYDLKITLAPYASLLRELSDSHGLLSGDQGIRMIVVRFEDWLRDSGAIPIEAQIDQLERRYEELVSLLKQFPLEAPLLGVLLSVSGDIHPELQGAIKSLQRRYFSLLEGLPGVHPLDWREMAHDYAISEACDPLRERQGHIPFSDPFYAAMAAETVRVALSSKRPPFKVIALDCDHTLWSGIIGEDGLEGIRITEAHRDFQTFLANKSEEGFLLLLLSKNNESDVRSVFDSHPEMQLSWQHITAHAINWEPKSANLDSLIRHLNLGLPSVLFLDDNAAECDAMRRTLPEVLSLQFPIDEASITSFVKRLWMLDKLDVTQEDRKRTEMYRAELDRQQVRQTSTNLQEFLEGLQLKVYLQTMEDAQMPRLSQLTMRTNQFNFTTIRHTEAEIRSLAQFGTRFYAIWVEDRFGAYGLSGLLALKVQDKKLHIDNFLLSCRVLGRGVEGVVFGALNSIAHDLGVDNVQLRYVRTERNAPAQQAASEHQWKIISQQEEETLYELPLHELPKIAETVDLIFGSPPKTEEASNTPAPLSNKKIVSIPQPSKTVGWRWELPDDSGIPASQQVHYLPFRHPTGDALWEAAAPRERQTITKRHYTPPRGLLEEGVARIFAELLGLERVGAEEDFFLLGGHSLQATRVLARLYRDFDIELGLDQFFAQPTPKALAQALEEATPESYGPIAPLPIMDDYPLSHAQRRFFVLQQMEKHFNAYHLSGAFDIRGALDEKVLQSAWRELQQRHPLLRSRVVEKAHDLRLEILQEGWMLKVQDLSGKSHPEHAAGHRFSEDVNRAFDLQKEIPIRAALYRLGEKQYRFTLVLHHMAADGWSVDVLARDLSSLYDAACKNSSPELAESPLPYMTFAVWQEKLLQGEKGQQLRDWWYQQLADAPYVELPLDFPRPAVQRFEGGCYETRLDGDAFRKVRQLVKKQRVGAFAPLLAALYALLQRYTGENDLTVGTASAGRIRMELEDSIGCYANTLALRTVTNSSGSFRELMKAAHHTITQAQVHQLYPFDALVDELELNRDISRPPLFDVMIVLENATGERWQLGDTEVKPLEQDSATSPFALTLLLQEEAGENGGLLLRIEYAAALFQHEKIRHLAHHYCALLHEGAQKPDAPLYALEMLSPEEKQGILQNSCTPSPAMPFHDLWSIFASVASQNLDRIALFYEDRSWSYQQLLHESEMISAQLLEAEAKPGQIVATLLPRSPQWIAAMLGIWRMGGIYLPIDPEYPSERIAWMLEDSGANHVLTRESGEFHLPPSAQAIRLSHQAECMPPTPATLAPTDAAYLIYTSGSTGAPKGTINHHSGLCNTANAQIRRFGVRPEDVVLQFASASFDASLSEVCMALFSGAALAIATRTEIEDTGKMEQFLGRHQVSVATFPPHYLAALQLPESLKTVITAGEPPVLEVAQRLAARGVRYFNAYGPSETAICAAIHQLDPTAHYPLGVPIGTVMEGACVYVCDRFGNLQPQGVSGEILIGGAGVGHGYLGRPALSRERFVDNRLGGQGKTYRTGDVGRWHDGELLFLGRQDAQIKVRGYRIEPGEIEIRLRQMKNIEDSVVEKCGQGGSARLVAFIKGGEISSDEAIRHHLHQSLPAHLIPDAFVHLEQFPCNASGKVDRKQLQQWDGPVSQTATVYVAPANEMERTVCQLWAEVLKTQPISAEDDFFSLGGNSLLAIMMLSRLKTATGHAVSLAALFVAPTPRALAGILQETGSEQHWIHSLNAQNCDEAWICFPPLPGWGNAFRTLADRLDGEVTIYAVDIPDNDRLIDSLLESIHNLPIRPPYRFLGYSGGGNLAYETARRLEHEGADVQTVVLLDAKRRITPLLLEPAGEEQLLQEAFAAFLPEKQEELRPILHERARGYLKYLNETINEGEIKAAIHVIEAEETYKSDHHGLTNDWQPGSRRHVDIHAGRGTHVEMLDDSVIELNIHLIRKLFSDPYHNIA